MDLVGGRPAEVEGLGRPLFPPLTRSSAASATRSWAVRFSGGRSFQRKSLSSMRGRLALLARALAQFRSRQRQQLKAISRCAKARWPNTAAGRESTNL